MSKGSGPDLRMAFVASDAGTAERLSMRLAPGTTWVSHLFQAVVRELLGSDDAMARIRAAGETYAQGREALLGALQPCDGFNVWMPLPADASAGAVAHALARLGWCVRTGEAFAIASDVLALRITTSTLEPTDAARFASHLNRCVQEA